MPSQLHVPLLFLLGLWFALPVNAQSPRFVQYAVDEGVPSSQTYSVIQDSRGYIWISTDRGVTRYNGYEFETFTTEDGLTDNVVFQLVEDHQNRIWCVTYNTRLCYFENDSIIEYEHNDVIAEQNYLALIRSLCFDQAGSLHIGFMYRGLMTIDADGNAKYTDREASVNYTLIHEIDSGAGVFSVGTVSQTEKYENPVQSVRIECNVPSYGMDSTLVLLGIEQQPGGIQKAIQLSNGNLLITIRNVIVELEPDGSFETYEIGESINHIYEDSKGNIWVGLLKAGAWRYPKGDLTASPLKMLPNRSCSWIFEDNERSIWITTLSEGIYYAPSSNVMELNAESGLSGDFPTSIANAGDLMVVGYQNGMVDFIPRHDYSSLFSSSTAYADNHVYRILPLEEWDLIYCSSVLGMRTFDFQGGFKSESRRLPLRSVQLSNDTLWVTYNKGIGYQTKDADTPEPFYENSDYERMPVILITPEGRKLVGRLGGLYEVRRDTLLPLSTEHPELGERVEDLMLLEDSTIVVATRGVGLLFWKDDQLTRLDESNGLASNLVNDIFLDEKKQIWAATNRGISMIQLEPQPQVRTFTTVHGLSSNEVHEVVAVDGEVWSAAQNGISIFQPDEVPADLPAPPIFIDQVRINNQDTVTLSHYDLSYNQNFVRFSFTGLAYRTLGNLEYEYRMLGLDSTWSRNVDRFVQFTTLPPGDYTFQVVAINGEGTRSAEVAQASITINPPWWSTWWFRLALIGLIALMVYLLFRLRLNQIRAREKLSSDLVAMELKALRSQMNPHFTFNTMNSIQHFVLKKDLEKVNYYLTRFSRLMRMTLEHSEIQVISVREEMESLSLYLELEGLRFEGRFEYHVEVDAKIDQDFDKIPSMLIQPYVENAIWHGISNLEGKGEIHISLKKEGERVLCSVEDNGVGRAKAKEIKQDRKQTFKSRGMQITRERLELLNAPNDKSNVVRITDLVDDEGQALGTRVEILIPLQ